MLIDRPAIFPNGCAVTARSRSSGSSSVIAMRAGIIMPRFTVLAPTLPPLRLQEREQVLRLVLVRTADLRSGRSGRPRRLACECFVQEGGGCHSPAGARHPGPGRPN